MTRFTSAPLAAVAAAALAEEPGAGRPFFVWQDVGVGEAGVVIGGHMDVVETDPFVACGMVAGGLVWVRPPSATVGDPVKLFEIDMDHGSRGITFIAAVCGTGSADSIPGDQVQVQVL